MRRSEVLGLRWCDINFEKKHLNLNHNIAWENDEWHLADLKTESSKRRIPLSHSIINELIRQRNRQLKYKEFLWDQYIKTDFIVTHDNGKPVHPGSLSNIFVDKLKQNTLRQIRFHDLRHTAASIMLKEGIDMKVISNILGHSSISITADLYSHVLDELKNKVSIPRLRDLQLAI